MAQAVRTVVTDDIDGTEIDPAEACTVHWSWNGVTYQFDTRTTRVADIQTGDHPATIAQLLSVSRRVHRRPAQRSGSRQPSGGTTTAAAIRDWARDNDIAVPSRGRIPAVIRERYVRAHRPTPTP